MLTQTLRKLERNNLVERRTLPTAPAGVEYRLTADEETSFAVLAAYADASANFVDTADMYGRRLRRMVRAGKVRHIAASNYTADRLGPQPSSPACCRA